MYEYANETDQGPTDIGEVSMMRVEWDGRGCEESVKGKSEKQNKSSMKMNVKKYKYKTR